MMPAIDSFLATWSPRVLSLLRIIVGHERARTFFLLSQSPAISEVGPLCAGARRPQHRVIASGLRKPHILGAAVAGANAEHRAAIREARVACWISAVASAAVKSAPAKRGVRSPG